jgi:hypothetical protein
MIDSRAGNAPLTAMDRRAMEQNLTDTLKDIQLRLEQIRGRL